MKDKFSVKPVGKSLGQHSRHSIYWQMRDYVYPQRFPIAKAFLCILIFIGSMPLLAELMGRVAQALGKGDVNGILQIAAFTVVIFVLRLLVGNKSSQKFRSSHCLYLREIS